MTSFFICGLRDLKIRMGLYPYVSLILGLGGGGGQFLPIHTLFMLQKCPFFRCQKQLLWVKLAPARPLLLNCNPVFFKLSILAKKANFRFYYSETFVNELCHTATINPRHIRYSDSDPILFNHIGQTWVYWHVICGL